MPDVTLTGADRYVQNEKCVHHQSTVAETPEQRANLKDTRVQGKYKANA